MPIKCLIVLNKKHKNPTSLIQILLNPKAYLVLISNAGKEFGGKDDNPDEVC